MKNIIQQEQQILSYWKKNKIFQKTLKNKKRNFVFYEGPPTANAKPGIHHVLARAFKDCVCRYKTMRGYKVIRKAGWDTHGLPVELEIEKKLGIKNKKEIQKYGIEKFNEKCRKSVFDYKKEWEELTDRIGFWLDMENPYITYDPFYIESVWWIIKQIAKKGLLYQDYKVVPYCPRCGTALSSHEVAQGYKRIKEPAIYVKFHILNSKFKIPNSRIYLLVWTTTPWTLPANVAIAVHPDLDYLLVKKDNEYYILAESRKEVLEGQGEVVKKFKGKILEGLKYEPLFDKEVVNLDIPSPNIYKVLLADFVSSEEGTGLVHIAPAFGEEDMELIKMQNAKYKMQNEKIPIILTVDEEGKFKKEVRRWEGVFVKDADPLIIEHLKEKGKLFKVEEYEHDYPFCWRCKTPLLYYAKKSWFIAMQKVKNKLIQNNQKINWIPEHIKTGRFGEWLKDLKDWALSRERFWGTPLPVWICEKCQHQEIIGSRKDLLKQRFSTNQYYLLRHGEALNNKKEIYSSYPEKKPFPLTEKGKKQVEAIAQKLKKEKIDLIFSSDLLRTKQTAEIIGKALGIKPIYDERLREIDTGRFNGKPIKEGNKFFNPENKLSQKELLLKKYNQGFPEGETYFQVRARMFDFIKEVEKRYQNKKILIISHKIPLLMLESLSFGLSDKEMMKPKKEWKIEEGELKKWEYKAFPYNKEGKLDLHRPYVDQIQFLCPVCGGRMKRVEEVIDCWFDSGSMPYAQWHYPFENKKLIDKRIQFPADFICEGIDQTRGWFYTLLAISTLLNFGPAYKNVIALGHVLDEKGEKMSKSKGNVVNPWEMIQKYGADAVRWYFYTINQPYEPKKFNEEDIKKALNKFLLTFLNSYKFLEIYKPKRFKLSTKWPKPSNLLDKWILSKLANLILTTQDLLDNYQITHATRLIEKFVIEDLSQWYIRRSRQRFQNPTNQKDLEKASQILGFVLYTLTKLSAPFIPFLSEHIYRQLGGRKSVHLEEWPRANKKKIDVRLENEMNFAQEIVSAGLFLRDKAKIKVRQPLLRLFVRTKRKLRKEILEIAKEELNLKEICFVNRIPKKPNLVFFENEIAKFALDTTITPELKQEGIIREVVRVIQDLRKKAKLVPSDKIEIYLWGPESIKQIIQAKEKEICKTTRAEKIYISKDEKVDICRELTIFGEKIWLGIKIC